MLKRAKDAIAPLLVFFTLLGIYLHSLAPGLTWAHFGADGGDLITAALTGGVAHPSGYPTYLLLARFFLALPLGESLAYRTNLLSALAASGAGLFTCWLVVRLLPGRTPLTQLAGLSAGLAFGLSPLVWSQAVITEVYALHVFFVAVILFLCFAKPGQFDVLVGFLLGLGLGNHLTLLLLLPIVFGQAFQKSGLAWPRLSKRSLGLGLGLLVYLSLPLRALSGSPVNWGNPATLEGFWWLVSGQLYRGQLFALSWDDFLARASALASLLWGQFGLPGLLIGLYGLVHRRFPWYEQLSLAWLALASAGIALLYATSDSFVYLLPALLCFALWIGAGLFDILSRFPNRWQWLGLLLGLFLLVQAGTNWPLVDVSTDSRAETFGAQVLATAPEDALLFAEGDQAVFALWYFHFALGERPDLVVVAADLIHFPWYLETLQNSYPGLAIPDLLISPQSLAAGNPSRPVCTVRYEHWTQLYCQPGGLPE
jgi:hypothetical protein